MNKILQCMLTSALLVPFNSLGHHSHTPYDVDTILSIEGIVTEYEWKNPHVLVRIQRQMPDGTISETQVNADAAAALIPFGTKADSVHPGDRVVVVASPHRRLGTRSMLGRQIIKDDGTTVGLTVAYARQLVSSGSARASSIAGTWLPEQRAAFNFNNRSRALPLTDAGRKGVEEFGLSSSPSISCIPSTAPHSMLYPALNTVEIQQDVILFRNDWMSAERIVYMDGRPHPENVERTIQGHSIGRWEDETLVIDTTHFADNRRGHLGLGVPSGARKHLVERITLDEDGMSLTYTFTDEDSDYLSEPVSGSFRWYHRPDMQPSRIECDLDIARQALDLE